MSDEIILEIGNAVSKKKIPRSALPSLLTDICKTGIPNEQQKILKNVYKANIPIEEIRLIVEERIDQMTNKCEKPKMGAVIGSIMKEYNHMLDGRYLTKIVEELL